MSTFDAPERRRMRRAASLDAVLRRNDLPRDVALSRGLPEIGCGRAPKVAIGALDEAARAATVGDFLTAEGDPRVARIRRRRANPGAAVAVGRGLGRPGIGCGGRAAVGTGSSEREEGEANED
jgi:hypothetical protein